MMAKTAEVLASELVRWGVRDVFGMPGSHSTSIHDALGRHETIRTILIRNEQAAAFAADGYARVSGKPGVVCTTAGPGATNTLTGIAEAWADSVPVLLISGQVNLNALDRERGDYHEIDLDSIFQAVTAWRGTLRRPGELPALVGQAFQSLTHGRRRPAALFLPQDLLREDCRPYADVLDFAPPPISQAPPEAVARAATLLAKAKRPMILAGGGALWSDAGDEILELAKRLDAPVITTLNAKGLIDERSEFSLGHGRSVRAKALLPHADAMLAVGCRFTEVFTDWRRMIVPKKLVQIDLDPGQIGVHYPVSVGIVADAKVTVAAIRKSLGSESSPSDWGDRWERARKTQQPKPEWLIDTLRAALPDDTAVFTDACEIGFRMQADWPSYAPRRFFYPSNYITLGWAFPAAVGAAVALDGPHVVSVSGDGGFVMTAQELATAARYRLRVIALVHNDSTYGAIKNIQRHNFQEHYVDVDLNNPDFLTLAAAHGIPADRARTPEELQAAVAAALDRDGPSLIEVPDDWRFLRDLAVPDTRAATS
jgi:acetolactate synthase-1/2/3 large subunit